MVFGIIKHTHLDCKYFPLSEFRIKPPMIKIKDNIIFKCTSDVYFWKINFKKSFSCLNVLNKVVNKVYIVNI